MSNSVDPDQTAPIGAVCPGSTLLASILKFASNVWELFAADDFNRRHFQIHFFLGALRVKQLCNMCVVAVDCKTDSTLLQNIICCTASASPFKTPLQQTVWTQITPLVRSGSTVCLYARISH